MDKRMRLPISLSDLALWQLAKGHTAATTLDIVVARERHTLNGTLKSGTYRHTSDAWNQVITRCPGPLIASQWYARRCTPRPVTVSGLRERAKTRFHETNSELVVSWPRFRVP